MATVRAGDYVRPKSGGQSFLVEEVTPEGKIVVQPHDVRFKLDPTKVERVRAPKAR